MPRRGRTNNTHQVCLSRSESLGRGRRHPDRHVGKGCSLTVSEVNLTDLASDPHETRYQGWAKSELSDNMGIDLMSIRVQMDYFDNGGT